VERKEPTLSGLEPATRSINEKRSEQRAEEKTRVQRAAPISNNEPVSPARVIAKSSPLLPFALMLALTGLGLAGFVYSELLKNQAASAVAEQRIQELEGRLSLSDDESSQSVAALGAKLKWADSEIRKLWGVAHDRNRKAIDGNKKALASVKSSLSAVKKEQKGVSASTAKVTASLDANKRSLKQLGQDLGQLGEQLAMVEGTSVEQQAQMRDLVDKANSLDLQVKKLKGSLLDRVNANAEAVASMDAYRRSTNRELLQIQQRLNQAPVAN